MFGVSAANALRASMGNLRPPIISKYPGAYNGTHSWNAGTRYVRIIVTGSGNNSPSYPSGTVWIHHKSTGAATAMRMFNIEETNGQDANIVTAALGSGSASFSCGDVIVSAGGSRWQAADLFVNQTDVYGGDVNLHSDRGEWYHRVYSSPADASRRSRNYSAPIWNGGTYGRSGQATGGGAAVVTGTGGGHPGVVTIEEFL